MLIKVNENLFVSDDEILTAARKGDIVHLDLKHIGHLEIADIGNGLWFQIQNAMEQRRK